jgi:drug/metabolite transporter (DMT)-like permease
MIRLPENPAVRASLFMVIAMASFVSNDTVVKAVGQGLPVGEIMMIRGGFAMAIIFAICIHQGALASLPQVRHRAVMIRASLDLLATVLFLTALMHMGIANLTAVTQSVPLAVALLSKLFLGENVGWRRVSAIVLGFIGVMLIVKPAPSTFTVYDGLALVIVFAVALRDLMTKRIPMRIPTFAIALVNASFVTAGGAALCLAGGAVWPSPWQFGLLALAAVFLSSGYLFMVATLRLGDLSATAPFRYTIVVFAIISGVVMFGEYPDGLALAGMALVIASGLYAAHREAKLRRTARAAAA